MLSIESSVQQFFPLNSLAYYIALFAAAIIYYTKAYISETTPNPNNKRSVWYLQHKKTMIASQLILTILLIISVAIIAKNIWLHILSMPWYHWLLLFIFPLIALLYYGIILPNHHLYNLRKTGWLKPFVIGFVWAGVVSIYPILFHYISINKAYQFSVFGMVLFIKNVMFIAVLCIMFDIKDYASDYNQQLKTFVVRVGLRKTIFNIMLPLCAIGFGTFLTYTISHHFPILRISINAIPFILLIIVAYSMHQRKSILYYLAIIDGLMLVKAISGIIGSTFIK